MNFTAEIKEALKNLHNNNQGLEKFVCCSTEYGGYKPIELMRCNKLLQEYISDFKYNIEDLNNFCIEHFNKINNLHDDNQKFLYELIEEGVSIQIKSAARQYLIDKFPQDIVDKTISCIESNCKPSKFTIIHSKYPTAI